MYGCPTCGGKIADSAKTCPHCGMDLRKKISGGALAVIIIVIVVITALIFNYATEEKQKRDREKAGRELGRQMIEDMRNAGN